MLRVIGYQLLVIGCQRSEVSPPTPLAQAAMISKNFRMNAPVDCQCVNVPEDGFAKITSETGRLLFIESKPGD